ncbi:ShlB/FhaC/HecB family hemolysin secretion/activation protein [Sporomusa sp. GT1]|uniref:ShlB/FhaC/HecB family hemolysin secretion/activation protein n=1 Tax=Sporomusa sp. GT1 TaxID=1534747 RepID=UPI0016652A35|nr:ShlB/FhaC/HecB family hemolysin secretion/activation protein [Sporomusa sp. GT1]
MKLQKISKAIIFCTILGISGNVSATPDTNEILQQQESIIQQKEQELGAKRAEAEMARQSRQQMTTLHKQTNNLAVFTLPEEQNSFKIEHFYLKADRFAHKFGWIDEYLQQFAGQKIGVQGINMLMNKINTEIVDRGYVTTRVYVEEQDLSQGRLFFTLAPGTIADIRFAEPGTWGTYGNALPMGKGSLLNIRDIEQGVDQMKYIPSQDVDIKIEPAQEMGKSNLVIHVQRSKPWSLVLTLDDSGTRETGKMQMSAALELDQLLSANDLFYISWNSDAEQAGERKGTRANSLFYSIPFGNDRVSYSHSHNEYRQTVTNAVLPFVSSGEFTSDQLSISHLLQRNQTSKTDLELAILHKKRRSYINGTEIEVQRQDTTAIQTGVSHRQYIGKSVLDTSVKWQKGVPWFKAVPGPTDSLAGEATTQYNMFLWGLSITAPVDYGKFTGQYNLSIRGQATGDRIYGSEFLSIGGRYSVRGFDGEQTLSAENGIVIRNELRFPLAPSHQLYTAVDYGKVSGPATEYLSGTELVGGAIGFRGKVSALQYDVSVGRPLKKPKGFTTAKQVYGFQLVTQL